MSPLVLLAVLVLAVGVSALGVATSRQPRWFLRVGTVTRLVTERVVVTQVTPSSCVEVAPSLAPCMHLPHEISPSPTTSIEVTKNLDGGRAFWDGWLASSKDQSDVVLVAPTPPVTDADAPGDDASTGGWRFNHLFDRLYSTVTHTVVEQATARIDDLDHVITFSVVGCLPTQLPFNLPLCHSGDGVDVGVAVEAAAAQGVATPVVPPVAGPDPRSVA